MAGNKKIMKIILSIFLFLSFSGQSQAWHDKTHLAVAKKAGYSQWFNTTGPDMAKIKAGDKESRNHYSNNPPDTVITPELILDQMARYDDPSDEKGHLYGAILASLRDYRSIKVTGKYAEYHLAFCLHYVTDLSMPLHNILHDSFNRLYHESMDGTVDSEVLDHLEQIKIYPVMIRSEGDLVREIARVANLSMKLGYRLEAESRLLTKKEAYSQLSHSASLIKAILEYVR